MREWSLTVKEWWSTEIGIKDAPISVWEWGSQELTLMVTYEIQSYKLRWLIFFL